VIVGKVRGFNTDTVVHRQALCTLGGTASAADFTYSDLDVWNSGTYGYGQQSIVVADHITTTGGTITDTCTGQANVLFDEGKLSAIKVGELH
jgi:hypothetical protein